MSDVPDITQNEAAPRAETWVLFRGRERSADGWAAVTRATLLFLLPLPWLLSAHGDSFTLYQVQTQDLLILLALAPVLLIAARWAPAWALPARLPRPLALLAIGCALVLLLGWASHALLGNFPISRDEHMVVFDMAVFEELRLAAPLAPEWRAFAEALVPAFLLNSAEPIGLVSSYLPMNAMLRLAFAQLADPAFYNPVLALLGGVALFDAARRLFPDDGRAQVVTLLVYGLSAQMLVNSMTTYAMTGHMALNLIWLAAFLRGGRAGHATAIGTGFLATGLHQVVFHPLFAAPFLLWRLRAGDRRLVLLYGGAYALIIGFWIAYPMLAAEHVGSPPPGRIDDSDFADRVIPLLLNRDPLTLPLMILNLLRFVAWQHLALLPLLAAAVPLAWRDRGPAAPMIWGIAAATAFIAFVLPYQGHGWGYRYLHPYLGSFALLAGLGYRRLAASAPRRTEGMIVALTLLTALGSAPLLLWRTYQFTWPHVLLDRHIAQQPGDFVLVDTDPVDRTTDGAWAINAVDEVRNHPDLVDRPMRFSSRSMDPRLTAELCRRGRVSVVSRGDMQRLGFGLNLAAANPRFDDLTSILREGGCLVQ